MHKIEQCDRDAAADLAQHLYGHRTAERIRSGELDHHPFVQAFAAHRIATIEQCADCRPCTAEDPNESAYQRGRHDGILEYERAIRNMKGGA